MNNRISNCAALCCAASIISAPAIVGAAPTPGMTARPSSAVGGSPPGADGQGDEELVYHWEKIVDLDGNAFEDLLVDTAVRELESGMQWIDLDEMIDAQGRRYRMVADAWQEAEDSDVHYEIKLLRYTPRILDEIELEQAWWNARPDGSDEEFEAFRARRATPPTPPSTTTEIDPELVRWLDHAGDDEVRLISVQLQPTESPLDLPRVSHSLFDTEPAFALAQMEARLWTIEARKNELAGIQAPVRDDLSRAGGEPLSPYWVVNAFDARVTPSALEHLASDPRVLRLEPFDASIADANYLDDMRQSVQLVQLHGAGYEGEVGSGRSAVNDIFMAIIDTTIDVDHPAWRDTSNPATSRLTDVWRYSGGSWTTPAVSATALPSHGTKVAGVAVADLTQGQDPAFVDPADRDDRTGMAPEARFAFIESSSGIKRSIEKAMDLSVDVVNYSGSVNYNCSLSHSTNDAVDEAMLDGVFFAKSSGSNGTPGPACNIGTPGAASGAFSVTSTDRSAVPLNTGLVWSGASHGPDNGRAVVAIAANGGPQGTAAAFDDGYGGFGATSAAAPVVAGSAAVLKEHLIDVFSAGLINEVGFLYATMLVAGDGQMDSGVAMAFDEMDGTWGAGRLRLRMFNAAGMDGPWRMRLFSRVIDDGELADNLYLNPDDAGVNQALSSDVDRIRAAIFWHEPNIEDATTSWARISSRVCSDDGYCYGSGTNTDQRQRLRVGNMAGGRTWQIELTGLDVPDSNDSDYYSGQPKRKVYVAVYWEDEDRDDGDGPDASIW